MTIQVYLSIIVVVLAIGFVMSITLGYHVLKDDYREKLKQDISYEQMLESEQVISNFLTQHNIKTNGSIAKIADVFKVKQGGDEPGLTSQAYLKEPNWKKEQIVVFKPGLPEEEKTFAFVHEIAHLINGDPSPATRPLGRHKSEIEQRADYVAAALLMPLNEIYDYLLEVNYKNISTRNKKIVISQLSKKYRVTDIVVIRRIREVYTLKEQDN